MPSQKIMRSYIRLSFMKIGANARIFAKACQCFQRGFHPWECNLPDTIPRTVVRQNVRRIRCTVRA